MFATVYRVWEDFNGRDVLATKAYFESEARAAQCRDELAAKWPDNRYSVKAHQVQPVMLKLADALAAKGEWCGPYIPTIAAGVWTAMPGTGYRPDYDTYAPHGRRLLDKKPA